MRKINTLQKVNMVSIQLVKEKSLPYGSKRINSMSLLDSYVAFERHKELIDSLI